MMSVNKSNSLKSFEKGQGKNTNSDTQEKTIFKYLFENTATASMVSEATSIPQKNICREKRKLEIDGKLKEVRKGICKITGFEAFYLSTNPEVWKQ